MRPSRGRADCRTLEVGSGSSRYAVEDVTTDKSRDHDVTAIDENIHGPESNDRTDDLEALAASEREMGHAAEADRLEVRMRRIREIDAAHPTGR